MGIPPQLSLDGAIVVLAEARSGSSLLMQTLHLLGKNIVGSALRPELPLGANPRGFFEQPQILVQGVHSPILAEHPLLLRNSAVKIALNPLVKRAALTGDEWSALTNSSAILLLPVRHPVEVLLSREVFARDASGAPPLPPMLSGIRSLLKNYGFLTRHFTENSGAIPPVCIDYAQATADPAGYVDLVARSAGIVPGPGQRRAAIANISGDLHRYRRSRLPVRWQQAIQTSRLEVAYAILRSGRPGMWHELRQTLPSWAVSPLPASTSSDDVRYPEN